MIYKTLLVAVLCIAVEFALATWSTRSEKKREGQGRRAGFPLALFVLFTVLLFASGVWSLSATVAGWLP